MTHLSKPNRSRSNKTGDAGGNDLTLEDPHRLVCLYSRAGPVPFRLLFDEVIAFRAIEAAANAMPDAAPRTMSAADRADLENFRRRTPAAALDRPNAELPPAGALAREAVIHFKLTLPAAMKKEIDRLLTAAYVTAAKALTDRVRRVHLDGVGDGAALPLPAGAATHPENAMASWELRNERAKFIAAATDNARATHPKGRGRQKGVSDSPESARAKKTAQAVREIEAEINRGISAHSDEARKALAQELFGRRSKKRGEKARLHGTLAGREHDVKPDTIKRRRLRAIRRKK